MNKEQNTENKDLTATFGNMQITKEDIINLGWTPSGNSICQWFKKTGYFHDNYHSYGTWTRATLILCEDNKIEIRAHECDFDSDNYEIQFQGQVKNLEELKIVLRQVGLV